MYRVVYFLAALCAGCEAGPDGGASDTSSPPNLEETKNVTDNSATMGADCATAGCAESEYCLSSYAVGSTELGNATCQALPAECAADATCACLLVATCTSCTDDADSGHAWCVE